MNSTPALGKARTYIDIEANFVPTQSSHFSHGKDGSFITISRAAGTGGSSFAEAIVRELTNREAGGVSWTILDSELVQQMLLDANLPARLARFLPEDRIPAVVSAVGEILGLHPDLWTLVERTNETVRLRHRDQHRHVLHGGGSRCRAGDPRPPAPRSCGRVSADQRRRTRRRARLASATTAIVAI